MANLPANEFTSKWAAARHAHAGLQLLLRLHACSQALNGLAPQGWEAELGQPAHVREQAAGVL